MVVSVYFVKHDKEYVVILVIDDNTIFILAQNEGVDNSWREKLGDERKRIGNFACFVSYITT